MDSQKYAVIIQIARVFIVHKVNACASLILWDICIVKDLLGIGLIIGTLLKKPLHKIFLIIKKILNHVLGI